MMHGASTAVYGLPSAVITRSPRPAAGPRFTNSTWSSAWLMIDGQFRPALRQVRSRKLAFENGILQMVAVPAHGLKHLAQPLVVADVVADQVGGAHGYSPRELPQPEMAAVAQAEGHSHRFCKLQLESVSRLRLVVLAVAPELYPFK